MDWIYRYIMVCTSAQRAQMNAFCASITGNPADAQTFNVPLSPTGSNPPTHYGTDTAATEALRDALLALLGGGVPAGFSYVKMSSEGEVQSTNVSGIQAGDVIVSWFSVIQALGLQIIYPDVHPS